MLSAAASVRPLSQWQPSSLVTFHTRSELTVAVVTWQQLLYSTLSAQLSPGEATNKKKSLAFFGDN